MQCGQAAKPGKERDGRVGCPKARLFLMPQSGPRGRRPGRPKRARSRLTRSSRQRDSEPGEESSSRMTHFSAAKRVTACRGRVPALNGSHFKDYIMSADAKNVKLSDLIQTWRIRRLTAFGSCTKGTARQDSDIDLLVKFRDKQKPSLIGQLTLAKLLSERFQRNGIV